MLQSTRNLFFINLYASSIFLINFFHFYPTYIEKKRGKFKHTVQIFFSFSSHFLNGLFCHSALMFLLGFNSKTKIQNMKYPNSYQNAPSNCHRIHTYKSNCHYACYYNHNANLCFPGHSAAFRKIIQMLFI